MHFGLFYELAVPGFTGKTEPQVYRETLDEIEQADRLGLDSVWLVEHHFMREYSHASAPDLFLAAASQRTRRIRLGHAIVLLPFWHPVRVAERIATLDILSGGRVEFGVGRGFTPVEYETFGVKMEDSRSLVDESMDVILRAWQPGRVKHAGRHFKVADVEVLPKPVQTPHPPIWTAAVSPETYDLAAQRGWGVLAGPFKPGFMILQDLERFKAGWSAAGRAAGDLRFAMTLGLFVANNRQHAHEVGKRNIAWFYRLLLQLTRPVLERAPKTYESYGELQKLLGASGQSMHEFMQNPDGMFEMLMEMNMILAGTPDDVCERIAQLAERGVTHLLCAAGAGGVPHAEVLSSLDLLAHEVVPQFRR
ncbi:MAG TPA: LLM class flavin-dependent oxidoreductase [Polyangia bacterium]|nr:LLM class flavin-dependent oxidoreductase [Polyangia bacterium]